MRIDLSDFRTIVVVYYQLAHSFDLRSTNIRFVSYNIGVHTVVVGHTYSKNKLLTNRILIRLLTHGGLS